MKLYKAIYFAEYILQTKKEKNLTKTHEQSESNLQQSNKSGMM